MFPYSSQDLSVLADRQDFEVPPAPQQDRTFPARLRRSATVVAVFSGVTFLMAALLFVPVLAFNLSRIEALDIAGTQVPAAEFVRQIGALFWGSSIVALAFTSFIAGARYMAAGPTIRPRPSSDSKQDVLLHLAMLRLIGSER